MKYMTQQWADAKSALVAAVKAAISARKAAAEKIQHECGQRIAARMGQYDPFGPSFIINKNVYSRGMYPEEMVRVLDPSQHWDTKLSVVRVETDFWDTFRSPEAWEAAWAAEQ